MRLTACTVVLALGLVCVRPRPAKAELTIATVTAVVILVGAIGDALSKWKPLFGGSGPDMSNQLEAVKVAIINELRSQRNQAWRANAQTVFDNFTILGRRAQNDPNNESLRASTLELSKVTFNQYSIIVEDGNDLGSSYELAPMFAVLTGVHTGLTKMKAELTPAFPAKWGEYDTYLKRAMQADNRLVGTHNSGCWPGYNPGKGHYVVFNFDGYLNAGGAPANYNKSQLWRKQMNYFVTLPFSIVKSACAAPAGPCSSSSTSMTCLANTIAGPTPYCLCSDLVPWSSPCMTRAVTLITAIGNNPDTGAFQSNGVVKIVHSAMTAILSVGGGDDRSDVATVPTSGALTDPWLDEPACGPFGSRSYPMIP